jgi:hypothetical protein
VPFLYGPVRVPGEAGPGKAKINLSFPDCKEGKVTPATFEVLIVEPKARSGPLQIRPAGGVEVRTPGR